jgi:hypothetical protein
LVTDTRRLRATIFERSGIAIDEHDPIMAVLIASAQQTEDIGERLLRRANPMRFVVAGVFFAVTIFAVAGTVVGWLLAQQRFEAERIQWQYLQSDPDVTALLRPEQGRAGLRLAELGVASLLLKCEGRQSWYVREGYCIPTTFDGRPDGFRVDANPNELGAEWIRSTF